METITKFKALDGSEWNSEEDCRKRDCLHLACELAMKPLGDVPKAVSSGEVCRAQGMADSFPVFLHPGRMIHPLSGVGRILDDYGGPLNKAWCRFCRIDEHGREHQQCYYAYTNGPLPEHVCVEDRRK